MQINLLEYLDASVTKHPQKKAFCDEQNHITYFQLNDYAKAVGTSIINKTNRKRNIPIAILVERNIHTLISYFGVLFSGNFYVPIDLHMPTERIRKIFEKINPEILISINDEPELLGKLDFKGQVINYNEAILENICEDELKNIRNQVIDTDPAYVVFTSGSTGTPKGVVISHRSVIDLIDQFAKTFKFSEDIIFGNQAPLDYDGSVKDIYSAVKNGATMHIIPKNFFSFPKYLIDYLESKRINTIIWATSALRIIANLNAFEKIRPSYLEKILFTGEVMPNKVLNYFRKHYPNALFANLYGPTEITCNCTYFIVDRPFDDDEDLPIGIPFNNTNVFLLNENIEPILIENEIGEICVRGSSLAMGYYNDQVETDKSFTANPVNPYYHDRIYRTGDLGKYNSRGELHFISRKDSQIKHMGYRIELGEIETAVNSIKEVDSAFCLHDNKNDHIILFYQSSIRDDQKILKILHNKLPKYMIPTKLVHYTKFPLKNNLKIDRTKIWEQFNNE